LSNVEFAPVDELATPTSDVDREPDGAQPEGAAPEAGAERDGRRRGGRGRGRREPREAEVTAEDAVSEALPVTTAIEAEPAPLALAAPVQDLLPLHVVAEPVAAAVPAIVAAPKVAQPFVLDADELRAVAEAAGLQWVGSDAEKIRAVQEAMANEPKPVHVPREPKPVVVFDEGPLVLVETRKDLAQYKLPFETSAG
jgi:ribonuclease E